MVKFKIFGSKLPTEEEKEPQIYVANIFAKNDVYARSRFFNLLNTKHKIKSTKACVLKVVPITEDISEMVVKNYGIKFYYRSKRCFHNMYKEFRAISRISAVEKLFSDMGGRHEVKNDMIFIVSVSEISDEEVKRPGVKEFCGDEVMFPLFEKNINKKSCTFVPKDSNIFE
ncbi:ribosomal protein L18a [Hamiltosporidium tvaerminnensis]|uniref:60S ribosomal protein L20 n=1 Tax=Hamiltosporidium tvaerminnensis TaxID=1176355 RepID=A0A4Q9LXW0_9MICR|nr:ribosomal protein L18a [Hamiltosporidium tvaerminnensis]